MADPKVMQRSQLPGLRRWRIIRRDDKKPPAEGPRAANSTYDWNDRLSSVRDRRIHGRQHDYSRPLCLSVSKPPVRSVLAARIYRIVRASPKRIRWHK